MKLLAHHLALGVRHLRRNPVLTTLVVVTLAVGVAASMTTLTVLRAMSGDPIPSKSDRLFTPLVDIRVDDGLDPDPEPPNQLTYRDAMALRGAGPVVRSSAVYRVGPTVSPSRQDVKPYFGEGMAVDADFFAMLDVPFVAGGPWAKEDDERAAHVVVLRESEAQKLFGEEEAVGRTVRLGTSDHVVTGVVSDDWAPMPKFYRVVSGPPPYMGVEHLFMPFTTAIDAQLSVQGTTNCYGNSGRSPGFEGLKQSDCVWIMFWVELASPRDAGAYSDFLAGYVADQRRLGRFPRANNNRLHDVRQWLDVNQVVPKDSRLQAALAFGFLLVCLVNTVGLLLAKFLARSGEIGVRRALGARRSTIFQQHLVEAGVAGAAGGLAGLVLTLLFLHVLGRQAEELEVLSRMDGTMLAATMGTAVVASLLAGLLPTWRACRVDPALQVKSQ